MDEWRVLRDLAADGLEHLGEVRLGAAVVVGDPTVLGRTPADGAYYAASIEPGRWLLLGRADEDDPDAIGELVAVHEGALAGFWEAYDAAAETAEVPAASGRVALLSALRKDDVELRMSLLEPDPDALPWVLDDGAVFAADPGHPARVFAGAETPLRLVSVTFGAAPVVMVGRPLNDSLEG